MEAHQYQLHSPTTEGGDVREKWDAALTITFILCIWRHPSPKGRDTPIPGGKKKSCPRTHWTDYSQRPTSMYIQHLCERTELSHTSR